jgi:hypothetical protein
VVTASAVLGTEKTDGTAINMIKTILLSYDAKHMPGGVPQELSWTGCY